ncbi:MAG: UDP-N-acetylmuramate dehydrogenase [Candidatus Saccharimonadales bacterium]
MEITENVALSNYSTMRLGGIARYLVEVRNRTELKEAYQWAQKQELPIIMIGHGSNVVWRDEGFPGLVMINRITGYDDYNEDALSHYITIGAGENWDSVVARSVASGLTGVEALSLVPGTAGATPIQNVGAYGQEISQTLTSIEAFDATTGQLVNIPAEACGFGYRTSKFQTEYRGRFFITAITLHLMASNPYPPFYSAIEQYFQQHPPAGTITPQVIRDAVIAIRQAKLPDPEVVANTGSFFANPIVDDGMLTDLRSDNPAMPYWPVEGGGAKIPAAWLIEQVGFKDVHDAETGMATWATQPLVLVNESATSTAQLLTFRNKIIAAVQQKYNITLKQEPELLPKQ